MKDQIVSKEFYAGKCGNIKNDLDIFQSIETFLENKNIMTY